MNNVAKTILAQLGGAGSMAAMCGCKDFLADEKSIQFKVGRNEKNISACRVVLDPSDTYTVEFYQGRGLKMRKCRELSNVYADSLRNLFEQTTGMYLSI